MNSEGDFDPTGREVTVLFEWKRRGELSWHIPDLGISVCGEYGPDAYNGVPDPQWTWCHDGARPGPRFGRVRTLLLAVMSAEYIVGATVYNDYPKPLPGEEQRA